MNVADDDADDDMRCCEIVYELYVVSSRYLETVLLLILFLYSCISFGRILTCPQPKILERRSSRKEVAGTQTRHGVVGNCCWARSLLDEGVARGGRFKFTLLARAKRMDPHSRTNYYVVARFDPCENGNVYIYGSNG